MKRPPRSCRQPRATQRMSSAAQRAGSRSRRIAQAACGVGLLLGLLAGCAGEPHGQAQNEMQWARAALERNPSLEVMTSDPDEQAFTIRWRNSGELELIRLSELAAAPIAQIDAAVPARAAQPEHTAAHAANASGQADLAAAQPTPAAAGSAPAQTSGDPLPTPTLAGSAQTASTDTAVTLPMADAQAAPPAYTIERSDGQVRVSGPGVSIVSSATPDAMTQASAPGQRFSDPIVCEGRRMLHFDRRDVHVDGTAITARGGCELHITNSRISATDIAVVVEDATVHITNSSVTGRTASFSAGDEARMYLRSSTFEGLPRRTAKAVVQDQGGNTWR